MNADRIKELEAMARFADELIEEYERYGEEVPDFVYEKILSIHTELIELIKVETEKIKADTKRLKVVTEAAKVANKVFENKGV